MLPGQTTLNFKPKATPSSKSNVSSGSALKTDNRYQTLSTDVESDKDDSTSSDNECNSDPEFHNRRMTAHKKARSRKPKDVSSELKGGKTTNKDKVNTGVKGDNSKGKGEKTSSDSSDKKLLPPPPIKILGVEDYLKLSELLQKKEVTRDDFTIRFISNSVWKVNPKNDVFAKTILETLKEENSLNEKVQYYTHENKNLQDLKRICKGLHPSIPIDDIIDDIKNKGFKINRVTCLMKRVPTPEEKNKILEKPKKTGQLNIDEMLTGQAKPNENSTSGAVPPSTATTSNAGGDSAHTPPDPNAKNVFIKDKDFKGKTHLVPIPVHQLDFDHEENIEKIYKINGICSMSVKIEPIRVKSDKIVQCKRCQSFNHTANQCGKTPRCVKCAGKHWTHECPCAKRIINPKCANCMTTGHPANYRGCPFAKEMQAERTSLIKKKKENSPPVSGKFPQLPVKGKGKNKKSQPSAGNQDKTGTHSSNAASYASRLINGDTNSSSNSANNEIIAQLLKTIESQRDMIEKLNERLARFESIFFNEAAD